MSDQVKKYFCPRLIDYVIFVGPKETNLIGGNRGNQSDELQQQQQPQQQQHQQLLAGDKHQNRVPHLLRRYPPEDHEDFSLPPDVVIFCQPEGCDHVKSSLNAYNNPSQTTNSFVFLLTEKDTSRIRYGVCLNFYRPIQKCPPAEATSVRQTARRSSNSQQNTTKPTSKEQDSYEIIPSAPEQQTNVIYPELIYRNEQQPHRQQYQDDKCSQSTQDNESGIKLSTGPDSDSVDSSGRPSRQAQSLSSQHMSERGQQQPQQQQRRFNSNQYQNYYQQRPSSNPRATKDSLKITYALNSICIISHHPFFSTFRECLFIMKKYIQACEERHSNSAYSSEPDKQPKCRCNFRFRAQRRGSQQSHQSQVSRRSAASNVMSHHFTCPYSNPIWSLLTMSHIDEMTISRPMMSDVAEIEAWILRLLSVPVPVPGKTKIQLEIMPPSLKPPLMFALPDHTRLSLIDFPLHLPLELLGVETCLQVLTCILLEHKVALQSKDYNALSMSVMAFVAMIYPLEYMFPVIPLLPSYMSSAEQLLLAPTPYIIGFPSSFFKFRCNFTLPNDVWIVDLDANKVKKPPNVEDLPPLPDYEGSILVQNLQKILDSMSHGVDATIRESSLPQIPLSSETDRIGKSSLQSATRVLTPKYPTNTKLQDAGQSSAPFSPFKRRSSVAAAGQLLQFAANKLSGTSTSSNMLDKTNRSSPSSSNRSSIAIQSTLVAAFNPLNVLGSNDLDAVDVAVRIAMVNFFNSQEVLANFVEHTRTIRLYPRPVVSFQKSSFIQSRAKISPFLMKLVDTQSVEYLAEWALCPDNVAFQRIQTGVYDPAIIGDKPKWYENQLELLRYQISDSENKEFYEEIANLIRDYSGIGSGVISNASRFSHYYDDKLELEDDCDENNNDGLHNCQYGGNESLGSYDINDNASQSSYVSSSIPSPSETMNRLDANVDRQTADAQRPLSLNDVMDLQMRRMSLSSSDSSNGSWDGDNRIMHTIPANYQHDIEMYPPLRCDPEKHYKPCNKLINSLQEARKWLGFDASTTVTLDSNIDGSGKYPTDFDRKSSYDSSITEEGDESLKNVPDSSSCDESGTEEFDFDSIRPTKADDTPEALEEDGGEVKLFESIDSDTIIATSSDNNNNNKTDENNNNNKTMTTMSHETHQRTLDDIGSFEEGVASEQTPRTLHHQSMDNDSIGSSTQARSKTQLPPTPNLGSDTMSTLLNSQKVRVSNGVAKLIDRASSMGTESKFLKQNSTQSSASVNQSPLPRNIGGEQMSAFFDRFTSEARDAVKEAKAALDAGKNALKTTAIPAADAGRQKLIKNLQNLGEGFLEERRESVSTNRSTAEEITTTASTPSATPVIGRAESVGQRRQSSSGQIDSEVMKAPPPESPQIRTSSSAAKSGTDFNEIAGRANSMISGWLGSKATAISNRMRDRARPFGPFPSIAEQDACMPPETIPEPVQAPPTAQMLPRRASLIDMRRSSLAYGQSQAKPRLNMLRKSALNHTIDETPEIDSGESEFFAGQKLVQKTRLIRHSTALSEQLDKPQPIRATQTDSDNQQFLKEVVGAVMKGEGIGWLKLNRMKKLMEDESYRDLVLTQINKNHDSRIRPDDRVSDVRVSKAVWRGMLKVCQAIVSGLEQSYMHNKLVGMASVFSLLEVSHTHYWTKDPADDQQTAMSSARTQQQSGGSLRSDSMSTEDILEREREQNKAIKTGELASSSNDDSRRSSQSTHDSSLSEQHSKKSLLAEIQERENLKDLDNVSSRPNGDPSSSGIDDSSNERSSQQHHQQQKTNDDSADIQKTFRQIWNIDQGLPQINKATLASGVTLNSLNEDTRIYLYEGLVQKDRSSLWDQVQFWEEAFLDAVSHERCLVGMDQGPDEMLERYKLLYEVDKKRLEHEEDRLLSTLLYNMVAFMLMLQVDHHHIKQKIRRLLGKCHIGLVNSAEINQLLEQIESLKGNDIDLKPMASRQQRRQTFTLYNGTDSSGDIVFMEVRDDGLVLRGLDGIIIERWWYERLINMTYSPRNKVVCFWRKSDGQTILNKYYTKKCQELYQCIKESMQRAASHHGANRVCSELGGEFPVLDMNSGAGGILQVCMEGVGLLFATSKYFIRLENIRKCFTQKGGTFVLEEYNPKTRQLVQNHFKSQMVDQICYAILCVFSYVAAGQSKSMALTKNQGVS